MNKQKIGMLAMGVLFIGLELDCSAIARLDRILILQWQSVFQI